MLPKASQRVSGVIRLANQIAREYEEEYVGTEHVLLAIQRDGAGLGAAILGKHGITDQKLRAAIDRLMKKRMEETWVFGRLPGTPHFKNVMAVAALQCQQLEDREIGTEHMLLALLQERGSVAYKALKALGLSYAAARADLLEMKGGRGG
jgi:ATP-dependent Clp protease ATP-binding subunit ClpC